MAMEVETRVLDHALRPSYKNYMPQNTHRAPTTKAFEIKVIYVRIINSSPKIMEIAFPPRSAGDRLRLNGTEISPQNAVSLPLNVNRVDLLMAESIFVSTNAVRFLGSLLRFEIRVKGLLPHIVGGVLRREEVWVMECKEGGGGLSGGLVDVYFVGTSMEKPLLLNRVVHLKNRSKLFEYYPTSEEHVKEKAVVRDEHYGSRGGGEVEEKSDHGDHQKESTDRDHEEELSLFREGVRVGMGLGLGMCVGVGFGAGLAIRSYKAATQVLRKFV